MCCVIDRETLSEVHKGFKKRRTYNEEAENKHFNEFSEKGKRMSHIVHVTTVWFLNYHMCVHHYATHKDEECKV